MPTTASQVGKQGFATFANFRLQVDITEADLEATCPVGSQESVRASTVMARSDGLDVEKAGEQGAGKECWGPVF